jgi:hypothetical protein
VDFNKHRGIPDSATVKAVNFIFGGMMNTFKGALAELLAAGPIAQRIEQLKHRRQLHPDTQVFIGDTVLATQFKKARKAKAADIHILRLDKLNATFELYGVGEVKSYRHSRSTALLQLDQHIERANTGLVVGGEKYAPRQRGFHRPTYTRIRVVPADWRLSCQFKVLNDNPRTWIFPELISPPLIKDTWEASDGIELLTLRWSVEALADAAFGFTFWYMAELGKRLYAEDRPTEWSEMSPEEAGQNAAKQSLYAAIMRCSPGSSSEQKAIALYNMYGFGYAVGMNFRAESGRRQMLFVEDLDEITVQGYSLIKSSDGRSCEKRSIRGFRVGAVTES